MKKQRQQEIWVILFSSAAIAAMLLADLLRAAEVPRIYVIFFGVVLSVGFSLMVTLELFDRLAPPRR